MLILSSGTVNLLKPAGATRPRVTATGEALLSVAGPTSAKSVYNQADVCHGGSDEAEETIDVAQASRTVTSYAAIEL